MSAQRQRPSTPDATMETRMQELARGDLSALGAIYDRHADDVVRFALRTTGHMDVAEDVTHDTFVALVDSAKRYDDNYSVRSFLFGIAGKLILRRRRRSAIGQRIFEQIRQSVRRVEQQTPEATVSATEGLDRYRAALSRLSAAKQITVVMADVEGLSGPEIAAALEVPIGTVWTRLHHARQELRRILGDHR